jgi:hypothetical protein
MKKTESVSISLVFKKYDNGKYPIHQPYVRNLQAVLRTRLQKPRKVFHIHPFPCFYDAVVGVVSDERHDDHS